MTFNSESTTDAVIAGIDLRGKTALVTGASAGLGIETAKTLAAAGARVVMLARDPDKLAAAVAGISEQQVEIIASDDYMESDLFTPRQKAAILWAEHVTLNTARSRNDVFDQVKALFSEPEILELTLVCGMFNMQNRVADSLHMDITEHDVERIKGSVQTDPETVRGYLQNIFDTWPEEFPLPSED